MKPRLNVHVSDELFDKVEIAAKRPGVTKAAVSRRRFSVSSRKSSTTNATARSSGGSTG
ncbi:hypothetical protein [Iodidimonas nitroreducens]|uniref:hypothetical protein n=1 Tax=Iodidimonas nitroreducens TaxID=1236968 RepID=UPI0028D17E8F|nr:hypothetical protein [Iodidimonas nitroreducens]